jgi:hypothetical protein
MWHVDKTEYAHWRRTETGTYEWWRAWNTEKVMIKRELSLSGMHPLRCENSGIGYNSDVMLFSPQPTATVHPVIWKNAVFFRENPFFFTPALWWNGEPFSYITMFLTITERVQFRMGSESHKWKAPLVFNFSSWLLIHIQISKLLNNAKNWIL